MDYRLSLRVFFFFLSTHIRKRNCGLIIFRNSNGRDALCLDCLECAAGVTLFSTRVIQLICFCS